MKISEQWLREWVNPRLDSGALAERLTMAGLEVGARAPAGPELPGVVVGEILDVSPHPGAESLRICRLRIDKKKECAIVSGARNARAGLKVAAALPGASLPNGQTIAPTEIRGVRSEGMLLSAVEMGIAESSEELFVLDRDAPVGAAVAAQLSLDDLVWELELTPNRGDCLSVLGVAREVSALTGAKLRAAAQRVVKPTTRRRFAVALNSPDCPHYVGRVIEGVDAAAVTPLWMRERLRRGGVRAIHPVVDVTNYVMLELGQPMHAFDLAKLNGGIVVRPARAGERLRLLDATTKEFAAGTLLIADQKGPVALAGIMGGQDTAVDETTRDIFLESAYFRPGAIGARARQLGLQTESSQRFERGVDPCLQRRAVERASELLQKICGGRPGPVAEAKRARDFPRAAHIGLRRARIERVLGAAPSAAEVSKSLKRLGMRARAATGGWRVTPPSHRFDLTREEDLIEEIARLHGYDRLPSRLPAIHMTAMPVAEGALGEARVRSLFIDRDYQEVITYSFVDPGIQALIDPDTPAKAIANPIAADMAVMRTSLWPGLLKALAYNRNRQQSRVRIFEIGCCFKPGNGELAQPKMMAGAATGEAWSRQWAAAPRLVDFFDVKGELQALFALTGRADAFEFRPQPHAALHPGQCAAIHEGGRAVGWIGVLHPGLQAKLDLGQPAVLFEIDFSVLGAVNLPKFQEISRFPSIRRDLAVTVPAETPVESVFQYTRKLAGNLLSNLELFDEYRGEGIDSGRKSLTLALTLQDSSRTLKETEADAVVSRVLSGLETRVGAQLRGKQEQSDKA